MKVAVSGTRTFKDYPLLCGFFKQHMPHPCTIIQGACRGVDLMAERYGKEHGFKVLEYRANWDEYGRGAGVLRNIEMAKAADMLLAIWDMKSRGTRHMLRTMHDLKKPIILFNFLDGQVMKYNAK